MSLKHVNQAVRMTILGEWAMEDHISKAGWCQCYCGDCTTVGKHRTCICGWCQDCPDSPAKEDK